MNSGCTGRSLREGTQQASNIHSKLPLHLINIAIDHLHGKPEALKRCSLVCRSWVARSSLHLFERVTWPPCYRKSNAWCAWELDEPGEETGCFEACWRLFADSARVSHSIKRFQIAKHTCVFKERNRPLDLNIVCELLDYLPQLQVLRFVDCVLLSTSLMKNLLYPSALQEFYFYWRDHSDMASLLEFLALFRRLSKVSIDWTELTPLEAEPDIPSLT